MADDPQTTIRWKVFKNTDRDTGGWCSYVEDSQHYLGGDLHRTKAEAETHAKKIAEAARPSDPQITAPTIKLDLMVAPQTTGWQPIETAPRGQGVLLFIPAVGAGYDARDAMIVTGVRDSSGEWELEGMSVSMDHHNTWSVLWERSPTHWMPLPEPPHG